MNINYTGIKISLDYKTSPNNVKLAKFLPN